MSLATFNKSIRYLTARHLLGRRRLIAHADSGASFAFQAADAVGRYLYKQGAYEHELSALLFHWEPRAADGLFVDVGANIGYYTVHMALRGIPVLAFEPDPLNYELLISNLHRNRCQGVEPLQVALSNQKGVAPFYRYPEKNLGRHSLLPINNALPIDVPTMTLDDVLTERDIAPQRIEMIKIDVEGFEPRVLQGMRRLLKEGEPTIVAEFTPSLMEQGGLSTRAFVDFMTDEGLSPFSITAAGLFPMHTRQLLELPADEGSNILWRRQASHNAATGAAA